MKTNHSYPSATKFIHWIMALIIISMLFMGVSMVKSLAVWQVTAVALHQSFGVLVLVLVMIRLINRWRTEAPPLPADLAKIQRLLAKITHVLLYLAMLLMPLSGWLMQNANGITVQFFGFFDLPVLLQQDLALYGLFRAIHGLTAWAFFALILMHIAAALYHGLVRKDGVLKSVLPSSEVKKN